MSEEINLWGEDILLDTSCNPQIAINGELVLTQNVQTGIQDVFLRLITYLGTLFYDDTFGSYLQDFTLEDNTKIQQSKLESELIRRIEEDPRVKVFSAKAKMINWDERELSVQLFWYFIGEDSISNLVLRYDKKLSQWITQYTNFKEPELEIE